MRLIEDIARNMASMENKAIFWEQYQNHVKTVVKSLMDGLISRGGDPVVIRALTDILNEKDS